MKVIVGMSGGVDSSTAAYLLKSQGYEVEGLSLILMEMRGHVPKSCPGLCCSVQAIEGAAETARRLGISHSVLDLTDEFMDMVVGPFIEAYRRGMTPNPCILCNRLVKFPYLIREAEKRGAEFIATGHYGVTENGILKKGVDPKKDQSYVLYALRKEDLNRLLLPLGGLRKEEVREIARDAGLPVFDMPESQEICFVGEDSYAAFIGQVEPSPEGPILDMDGHEIGRHKGIHHYTIGQRKGLGGQRKGLDGQRKGLGSPEPLFVVGIDPEKNAIYAGPREAAFKAEFIVGDINWLIEKGGDFRATVKVRSMMKDEPAAVYLEDDRVKVVYDLPQWAPAPGQSAVFYDGDIVIGGGVIEKVIG